MKTNKTLAITFGMAIAAGATAAAAQIGNAPSPGGGLDTPSTSAPSTPDADRRVPSGSVSNEAEARNKTSVDTGEAGSASAPGTPSTSDAPDTASAQNRLSGMGPQEFGDMDSDGSGQIERAEAADSQLPEASFGRIDADGSDSISQQEFEAAISDARKFQTQDLTELQGEFERMDTDSDGTISQGEAQANNQLNDAFSEADTDGNNQLSEQEFSSVIAESGDSNVNRSVSANPQQGTASVSADASANESIEGPAGTSASSESTAGNESQARIDSPSVPSGSSAPSTPDAPGTAMSDLANADPQQFDQMDQNADGQLDRNEAAESQILNTAFEQMDSDGNGNVSQSEFENAVEEANQAQTTDLSDLQGQFDEFDQNNNNTISPEEAQSDAKLAEMFEDSDFNNDDRLTRPEYRAALDAEADNEGASASGEGEIEAAE